MVSEAEPGQITELLLDWRAGDDQARDRLFDSLYAELRRLAAIQLSGGRGGDTLQPTALVSEAYLRLIDASGVDWQDRAHFLSLAVSVMRRVLVDHARRRNAAKRGAGLVHVTLPPDVAASSEDVDVELVDTAVEALSKIHPRQGRIVELRFFGGLEVREVAEVLGVSTATVKRDWAAGRLWLFRELQRP